MRADSDRNASAIGEGFVPRRQKFRAFIEYRFQRGLLLRAEPRDEYVEHARRHKIDDVKRMIVRARVFVHEIGISSRGKTFFQLFEKVRCLR